MEKRENETPYLEAGDDGGPVKDEGADGEKTKHREQGKGEGGNEESASDRGYIQEETLEIKIVDTAQIVRWSRHDMEVERMKLA